MRVTNRTTGDPHRIECPSCGRMIQNLWYTHSLTGLYNAEMIDCEHCGKAVEVESCDITINLVSREPKEVSGDEVLPRTS